MKLYQIIFGVMWYNFIDAKLIFNDITVRMHASSLSVVKIVLSISRKVHVQLIKNFLSDQDQNTKSLLGQAVWN